MPRGPGKIQKKVLILLAAGASLAFAYNPHQRKRVWEQVSEEFEKINNRDLQRTVNSLYENSFIDYRQYKNGIVKVILTKNGRKKVLAYNIDKIKIKMPKKWDKKWRMVLFDVPHAYRKARDSLRLHLKQLGFYQLQKSVFVFPYECKDEIDFIVEVHDVGKFVRYAVVDSIDNEAHLKQVFRGILK